MVLLEILAPKLEHNQVEHLQQVQREQVALFMHLTLEQLPQVEAKKKAKDREKARVSTTDCDARVMKMADGGYRPAYNVQFATDTQSQVITLRGWHLEELRDQLRGTGFEVEGVYGDMSGGTFDPETSHDLVVLSRRTGD